MNAPKKFPANQTIDAAHVAQLRHAGKLLFELGMVYGTPAALKLLEANGMYPNALLGAHCHGDFGQVDDEDWKTNDRAVVDGSRILSVYSVGGQTVWVITDAVNEVGVRRTTSLLLPSEY